MKKEIEEIKKNMDEITKTIDSINVNDVVKLLENDNILDKKIDKIYFNSMVMGWNRTIKEKYNILYFLHKYSSGKVSFQYIDISKKLDKNNEYNNFYVSLKISKTGGKRYKYRHFLAFYKYRYFLVFYMFDVGKVIKNTISTRIISKEIAKFFTAEELKMISDEFKKMDTLTKLAAL